MNQAARREVPTYPRELQHWPHEKSVLLAFVEPGKEPKGGTVFGFQTKRFEDDQESVKRAHAWAQKQVRPLVEKSQRIEASGKPPAARAFFTVSKELLDIFRRHGLPNPLTGEPL